MKKLRKAFVPILAFLLMISFAACGSMPASESIHKRVHTAYIDMPAYSARCLVTSYTKVGQNDYECTVEYDKQNNSYKVVSDDMEMVITDEKTVFSKGDNVIETPSSHNDMSIFLNTFFKSYYEAESASLSVSKTDGENSTLLECDVINPNPAQSHMKLWIDNETVLPLRMQVFGKDDFLNTEITFREFTPYKN